MPMNLPEISENDGATVKYHDYTDTKNSCSIAKAFVGSKCFFLQTGHVFFRRLYLNVVLGSILKLKTCFPTLLGGGGG
jgi:hypothetical protein